MKISLLLVLVSSVALLVRADEITLTPEQSTGGKMIHTADGTPAVTLDSTCPEPKPDGAHLEWQPASPLAPGWWHATLHLAPREGDDKGWVNTHIGILLTSAQKPMVNMMTN